MSGNTELGLLSKVVIGIVTVVAVLGIIIVVAGIKTVEIGEVGLVFDKQRNIIEPVPLGMGWNWVNPITKDVIILSTRVQKETLMLEAASSDSQVVRTELTLNFQIPAGSWPWVYENIGDMDMVLAKIIDPQIKESLKSSTAKFKGEVLIPRRGEVKIEVTESLSHNLDKSKIVVTEVSLTDFQFNEDYQAAIERKQVASQDALTAEHKLTQKTIEANITIVQAEAEARKVEIIGQAVTNNPGVVDLELARRWDGILPETVWIMGSDQLGGPLSIIANQPGAKAST